MSYPEGFEPLPEPAPADRTWKYPPEAYADEDDPEGGDDA